MNMQRCQRPMNDVHQTAKYSLLYRCCSYCYCIYNYLHLSLGNIYNLIQMSAMQTIKQWHSIVDSNSNNNNKTKNNNSYSSNSKISRNSRHIMQAIKDNEACHMQPFVLHTYEYIHTHSLSVTNMYTCVYYNIYLFKCKCANAIKLHSWKQPLKGDGASTLISREIFRFKYLFIVVLQWPTHGRQFR